MSTLAKSAWSLCEPVGISKSDGAHLSEEELIVKVLFLRLGQGPTRMLNKVFGVCEAQVLSADSTTSVPAEEGRTAAIGSIARPVGHSAQESK